MSDAVYLSINSGSSSLKLGLYDFAQGERRLVEAEVEGIGLPEGIAWVVRDGRRDERPARFEGRGAALHAGLDLLGEGTLAGLRAAGHRVVHGGPRFSEPRRIDSGVLEELRRLVPLAPLHLPPAIEAIEAIGQRLPGLPQVACFDTAFHVTLPPRARRLPIPERFDQAGVRRYGFHGLSYEYILSALGPSRPARIIIAHLGNGASLAAVKDGRSIDTTMGFTPAGGILMGTRPGDLDPGALVYLLRTLGLTAEQLDRVIERESGLAGIAGTWEMRTLLERSPTDERARLAVEMFCYDVRKTVGAFAAALGGIDLLVFTGGIGEHAAPVRADICEGLAHLGIALDPERNRLAAPVISRDGARCEVRVIATDEDIVIARGARVVLG